MPRQVPRAGANSIMKTKKEIKSLYDAGKLKNLIPYIITDGTKKDAVNALYLLFKEERGEYRVAFESLPYSRGGKYARHTSTLYSSQRWEVREIGGEFYVEKSSSSKSSACPPVMVPKFYTEAGKIFHNSLIEKKIDELKNELL